MRVYRKRLLSYVFFEEGKKVLVVAHGLAIMALLAEAVKEKSKYG